LTVDAARQDMDGEIGTDELRSIHDGESVRVVDIRPAQAFARGHIPDSENVPFQLLVDRIEDFEGDDRVVTVCPHGKSSVQAARLIAAYEEFDGRVESYAPGLDDWDGPVESGFDDADEEGPAAPF
jgi:rhodanese-related sulfurtransferase